MPKAIKEQRAKRGLSMRALGALLDVSHSTIADWEHARSYPSSYEIQRLAELMGVTICELYGVEEGHTLPQATAGLSQRAAEVRDRYVADMRASEGRASAAELEFADEIARAVTRLRERLLAEENAVIWPAPR